MKLKGIVLAGLLTALIGAAPAQGKITFGRAYKVGETDVYSVKTEMSSPIHGTMAVKLTEEVVKVYDNGDADIKTTLSELKVVVDGKDVPQPKSLKATTERMNTYGAPVTFKGGAGGMFEVMLSATNGFRGTVNLGQTIQFDLQDPSEPNFSTKGKFAFVSSKAGVDLFNLSEDLMDKRQKGANHVAGICGFEALSHKLVKMDATMSPGDPKGPAFHLVMERKGS